jgi:hypothetical protein
VTDGADVDVRLRAFEFTFCHFRTPEYLKNSASGRFKVSTGEFARRPLAAVVSR